jgi:hypothetical protein
MKPTSLKSKKCKGCGDSFIPRTGLQVVCGVPCSIKYTRIKKERKLAQREARRLREGRERLKSKSDHLKEAQTQVNRWVRLRDHDQPCISCQRHHDGQYHAGHYRSVGSAPELRFCADSNLAKQCSVCNNHLSGNLILFRKHLIERIGLEKVEWLEGPHEPLKLTIPEIKDIKDKYRLKANKLAKELDRYD